MIKKRMIIILLMLACIFSLSGCKTDVQRTGVENFDPNTSSVGLTSYFLPSDDFLEKFEYIDSQYNYHLKEEGILYNTRETCFMALWYDDNVYEEAKTFMLETVPLSEKHRYEYGNYYFIENLSLPMHYSNYTEDDENVRFPDHSTMVGYHDEKKVLIFIGLDVSDDERDKAEEIMETSDWGTFLKEYFSVYDFDA